MTGFIIASVSSPIDNVKVKLMTKGNGVYNGVFDCAKKIMKESGPRVFYKGFTSQWVMWSPFVIAQILIYESIRKMCGMEGM